MKGHNDNLAKYVNSYLPTFVFSFLSIASFFFLTASPASADTSASASASVTVGAACTFTSVVNTAHTATIPSGTNQSDIGQTTFTMVCNDNGGYSIYAVGYSNNEVGNNKLLATVNGALNSTYDINTGTNTSGDPSSWAMKLTPGTNLTTSNILNGYSSYSTVPAAYTKVATLIPTTTVVNPSSLQATYRVNVAHTQPAGNYNGKVRFVMVDPNTNVPNEPVPAAATFISYNPNANGEVVDTMGNQSVSSDATSVTLWPSNFQRPGYGFAGWSDAYDYVVNAGSESNPDAHIYGPNETIDDATTIAGIKSDGLSLYAVWVKSEGNLQGWNGCSSLGSGEVTALTDVRDNDTYAVAKLIDGNCWMIENLRLDYDADITTSNTQSDNGAFGGVFYGLAEPENANFTSSTTANSLYKSDDSGDVAGINGATLSDISTDIYPESRFPRYNNNNTHLTTTNMNGYSANVYSYGHYYTWAAATATTEQVYGSSVATSLCASGWTLPHGTNYNDGSSDGGYFKLNYLLNNNTNASDAAASKKLRIYPNNFLLSGRYTNTSTYARGSEGWYWTSRSYSWDYGYLFFLNATSVSFGGSTKTNGRSVRCVMNS